MKRLTLSKSGPRPPNPSTYWGNLKQSENRKTRGCRPCVFSAAGRLPQCSLHDRIERAEEPRLVPLGQRGWSAGIRSQLPEVPRDLATDERVSYIRLRPLLAGRGDDARPLFETA